MLYPGLVFFLHVATSCQDQIRLPQSSSEDADDLRDVNTHAEKKDYSSDLALEDTSKNIIMYRSPLPTSFPGENPLIMALHSPVHMYIPIRYMGAMSAESPGCVQCPKNMVLYRSGKGPILTPVPILSICQSLAHRPGRVHIAMVTGPRPGQPLKLGRNQMELVIWKAKGPVHSCSYTITVRKKRRTKSKRPIKKRRRPCPSPDLTENVAMACDPPKETGKRNLPHGSVCQFFCPPNFANKSNGSSSILCRNGRWYPAVQITCEAIKCPTAQPPKHGIWNCTPTNKATALEEGAQCTIRCDSGYVVPTSQLNVDTIVCHPPNWNRTGVAICIKTRLPRIMNCSDRQVIVKKGQVVRLSEELLPIGVTHGGLALQPTCRLQGELSPGEHQNDCEVVDPELRSVNNCSYVILVEARSNPWSDDCVNIKRDHLISDPVRFWVNVSEASPRTEELTSECISEVDLTVTCKATDPITNVTARCSFRITESIETPKLVSGCENITLVGFSPLNITVPLPVFITHLNETVLTSCTPSYIVSPGRQTVSCSTLDDDGACIFEVDVQLEEEDITTEESAQSEVELPRLASGCEDITLVGSIPLNISVPLPLFLTPLNDTVLVSCTPPFITIPDRQNISCNTVNGDTCTFEVDVQLEEEDIIKESVYKNAKSPRLVSGCENQTVVASSPLNVSVPSPLFLTPMNETVSVFCTPPYVISPGRVNVSCNTADGDGECAFEVNVQLTTEEPPQNKAESLTLLSGCEDLTLVGSIPLNISVPLPLFLTPLNDTVLAFCTPPYVIIPDRQNVSCSTMDGDGTCTFEVGVQLEEEQIATEETAQNKAEPPRLASGCESMTVVGFSPLNISVPSPLFRTPLNETLIAFCTPRYITSPGNQNVSCSTLDGDGTCTFEIDAQLEEEDFTTSELLQEEGKIPCHPLRSPLHATLECEELVSCLITCDKGFGLFGQTDPLLVNCENGSWNLHNLDIQPTLPDCLAQMEGSAVEVWMGFQAIAPQCGEELEKWLQSQVEVLCPTGTRCGDVSLSCTLEEENDVVLISVNWTAQADFEPEDMDSMDEIPEAETRLEAALENGRAFLASAEHFEGLHFIRNSFRKGLITLVCPDRFIPDMTAAKCVENIT